MLDYLTKFNALPQYLKDKMSDPSILSTVKDLEEEYEISLAAVVMKIMVKDVSILDLSKYFIFEYSLDGQKAEKLVEEMKEKVLFVASDYLGFETKRKKNTIGIEKNKAGVDKIKSSNFFFSSEDEQEVAQLTQKLGPKDKHKEINEERLNNIVNDVVFDTGVNFSSQDLSERFVKVLKTYIRGVRNKIDTKITLGKEVNNGGLGMSEGRVEEIIKILDEKNKKKEDNFLEIKLKDDSLEGEFVKKETAKVDVSKFREKMKKVEGADPVDVSYDLSSMPKKEAIKAIEKKEALKESKIIQKPKLNSKGLPDTLTIASKEKIGDIKIVKKIDQKENKLDDHIAGKDGKFKKRLVVPDSGKKKIEDVKVIPKLIGPIDELRNLDIVDFRRLDPSPMRAAAKIKEKINLLEEDGYGKKLEGINAWRKSKIFSEYIDIGRKSIGQKKPINEIINDKNISGQDSLREDEFEAVLNLNKEVRY